MARRKKAKKKKTVKKAVKKGKKVKKKIVDLGKRATEWLRDIGMVSLGFASLAKEEKGRVSGYSVSKCKTEGKRMEKKLLDMAKTRRKKVYSVIKKQTATALDELNVATKDDLRDLEKRLKRR